MRNPTNRRALSCLPLEDRSCPAGQILVFFGTMTVVGDGGANVVSITDTGNGTISATIDGTTKTASGIHAVFVGTGAGNDQINYALTGNQTGARAVSVLAGSGDDQVTMNAANILGLFAFNAFGADGADTITANVQGVAAKAGLTVAMDGGHGNDSVSATADGKLDGVMSIGLSGAAGNDHVSGTANIAAGSLGRLFFGVSGGLGDDTLALNVTGAGLPTMQKVLLGLDGGPGIDVATTTPNVTVAQIP